MSKEYMVYIEIRILLNKMNILVSMCSASEAQQYVEKYWME